MEKSRMKFKFTLYMELFNDNVINCSTDDKVFANVWCKTITSFCRLFNQFYALFEHHASSKEFPHNKSLSFGFDDVTIRIRYRRSSDVADGFVCSRPKRL